MPPRKIKDPLSAFKRAELQQVAKYLHIPLKPSALKDDYIRAIRSALVENVQSNSYFSPSLRSYTPAPSATTVLFYDKAPHIRMATAGHESPELSDEMLLQLIESGAIPSLTPVASPNTATPFVSTLTSATPLPMSSSGTSFTRAAPFGSAATTAAWSGGLTAGSVGAGNGLRTSGYPQASHAGQTTSYPYGYIGNSMQTSVSRSGPSGGASATLAATSAATSAVPQRHKAKSTDQLPQHLKQQLLHLQRLQQSQQQGKKQQGQKQHLQQQGLSSSTDSHVHHAHVTDSTPQYALKMKPENYAQYKGVPVQDLVIPLPLKLCAVLHQFKQRNKFRCPMRDQIDEFIYDPKTCKLTHQTTKRSFQVVKDSSERFTLPLEEIGLYMGIVTRGLPKYLALQHMKEHPTDPSAAYNATSDAFAELMTVKLTDFFRDQSKAQSEADAEAEKQREKQNAVSLDPRANKAFGNSKILEVCSQLPIFDQLCCSPSAQRENLANLLRQEVKMCKWYRAGAKGYFEDKATELSQQTTLNDLNTLVSETLAALKKHVLLNTSGESMPSLFAPYADRAHDQDESLQVVGIERSTSAATKPAASRRQSECAASDTAGATASDADEDLICLD
eukprot:m.42870 g.42870  ORF g.42870 m.42870 type:complete len:618 (-) comp10741_c0_seq4:3510-5363(-)